MTPVVEIVRLQTTKEHGTFSVLKINKDLFCWNLEPYEYGNITNLSCIPAGQYMCTRVKSSLVERATKGRMNETFEITGIPGRLLVRFHPGNTKEDTLGCQLLGETLGKLKGKRAVLNSGETFLRFMAVLDEYDEFSLTIKEAY